MTRHYPWERAEMLLELITTNLHLFDGGASGGAAPGGEGSASAGSEVAANGRQSRSKGEFANVVYGKPEEGTASGESIDNGNGGEADHIEKTLEDRTKEYEKLIKGEFKDIHQSNIDRIVKNRLKDYNDVKKLADDQGAIIERLNSKYHTDGNLESLLQAIDNDDAMWQDEAYEAGLSVEQYKELKKLERENSKLLNAEKERQAQAKAQAQVEAWTQEAEALKSKIPAFDLANELQNPEFGRLVQSGIPMETAFKVTHFDELANGLASAVQAQTEKKITDNVRAKGNRPVENGTTTTSAFTYKTDVSKLTRADRAEIARRAAQGDKISF